MKWIYKYLIRKGSFWFVKESIIIGLWMWRKIFKIRDVVRSFYRMEVNNGVVISFWYDYWSSMGRLKDLLGERGFVDMGILENLIIVEVI